MCVCVVEKREKFDTRANTKHMQSKVKSEKTEGNASGQKTKWHVVALLCTWVRAGGERRVPSSGPGSRQEWVLVGPSVQEKKRHGEENILKVCGGVGIHH